jgi:hypothetical protein
MVLSKFGMSRLSQGAQTLEGMPDQSMPCHSLKMGYLLATAGLDAVKIWDLRKYGDDTPVNGGFAK